MSSDIKDFNYFIM